MDTTEETQFNTYLKRYSETYGLTHDEAERHKMVQLVKEYYESEECYSE